MRLRWWRGNDNTNGKVYDYLHDNIKEENMRLRDTLILITESLSAINNIKFVNESSSFKIENIEKVHAHFRKLSKIEVFKKDIELLLTEHIFLVTELQFIYIDRNIFIECKKKVDNIRNKCNILNSLLTQIVQTQDRNTISFRLYKFGNFSEFCDFCEDLNKKILIPLNKLNIDVHLGELETGTDWLSIVCGVGLGVMLLAAIVRQAFDILIYDYQKFRVTKSLNESIQMGNEFMEEYNKKVLEYMDKIKDEKTDQIINEIREYEGFPLEDDGLLNEFRNAVKISIDFMGKHIDKGLEVYQALDIKESERYKLPDFAQLMVARQPQQLIVDNTEKVVNNDIKSPDENSNKEKD
jgi:hypothetical protein